MTRTIKKNSFSWVMNIDLAFMDGLILWFWIFSTEPMIFISPTFGTIFPFCLSQSSRYNNKHANLVIPPIFGCCRLVFHRVNGSPQTEAASFLANLFSLVVKSPPGCLCWPSQHHGLPPLFFPSLFLLGCTDWWSELTLLNITASPLTIGDSPAPSKQSLDSCQRWRAGPCCLPEQRSVFLAHHSSSTLSRLFNSPHLWCYLTGEGVCVCVFVYSVLSAVGGGGWWG